MPVGKAVDCESSFRFGQSVNVRGTSYNFGDILFQLWFRQTPLLSQSQQELNLFVGRLGCVPIRLIVVVSIGLLTVDVSVGLADS